MPRPDIFQFHHYRPFLKEWFAYLRANDVHFSLKSLAKAAQVASGYLPMVLAGTRKLSRKALDKLGPHLRLSKSEIVYFEELVRLEGSDSQEEKLLIFSRIKRSTSFQRHNPVAAELLEYMSSWYHIAIREMTALPDFQMNPDWIQKRLHFDVSIKDIEASLEFLKRNGYIQVNADGVVLPPKENLKAAGEIYWAALTTYHRQMFQLATQSIDNTPSEQRKLLGYSFALPESTFDRAQEILTKALDDIKALERSSTEEPPGRVYHLELALFPLSKGRPS